MVKYHIGKNGPAPCGANPDKPGGRECRYKDGIHGSEEEVQKAYEKQMEESGASVSVIAKKPPLEENAAIKITRSVLSNENSYSVKDYYENIFSEEGLNSIVRDQKIAMQLALTNISPLAYTPVKNEDEEFYSEGFSSTRKLELEDGTVGYFKSFLENSDDQESLDVIDYYGETTISSTINEVNAYRMAKAMGPEYEKLIPETVVREHNGHLGSFQRGVQGEAVKDPGLSDPANSRKAALLDSVLNSQDRHRGNALEGKDENGNPTLYLIDNSFSFSKGDYGRNQTIFSTIYDSEKLDKNEKEALKKAKEASKKWEKEGTLNSERAGALRYRIERMERDDRIIVFF